MQEVAAVGPEPPGHPPASRSTWPLPPGLPFLGKVRSPTWGSPPDPLETPAWSHANNSSLHSQSCGRQGGYLLIAAHPTWRGKDRQLRKLEQ